jgi:hypothetical protein
MYVPTTYSRHCCPIIQGYRVYKGGLSSPASVPHLDYPLHCSTTVEFLCEGKQEKIVERLQHVAFSYSYFASAGEVEHGRQPWRGYRVRHSINPYRNALQGRQEARHNYRSRAEGKPHEVH